MGFGRLFADEGDWMPERVSNFGNPWEIIQPGLKLKLYPCCGGGQRPIELLLLEILAKQPLKPGEVSRVDVKVPAANYGQGMIHRRPKTGLQGKFSMEYCVAAAILDGKVSLATFTDEAVLRPEAQEFFPKVFEAPHESKDKSVEVTVHLRDGSICHCRMEHASGSIKKPMSRQQVEQKFRDCAMTVLPEEQVAASITLINELNEVDDVARLTEQLCVPARV
jgi:2-methylcitrate dehydratase PrpD